MSGFNAQHLAEAFEFKDLSKSVKKHVAKVYTYLSGLMVTAVVGCFLNISYQIGGFGTGILAAIVFFFIMFADQKNSLRVPALGLFGLLKGMSLGPIVKAALHLDPSIILTALLATTCIFICFSLAAYFAEKRLHIYLAGFLSAGVIILMLTSFLSLFGGHQFFFNVQLYLGLLVFMGYVVFDTQVMVARAERGIKDPVTDSLQLFIDFVAIFVRILLILMKDNKKDKK